MANPNLRTLTEQYVDTLHYDVTESVATVTGSTVAGDYARKVESILAINQGATLGEVKVWHRRGGVDYPVGSPGGKRVPPKDSVNILLGSPIYMYDGDSLRAQALVDGTVHLAIPIVDMTDA